MRFVRCTVVLRDPSAEKNDNLQQREDGDFVDFVVFARFVFQNRLGPDWAGGVGIHAESAFSSLLHREPVIVRGWPRTRNGPRRVLSSARCAGRDPLVSASWCVLVFWRFNAFALLPPPSLSLSPSRVQLSDFLPFLHAFSPSHRPSFCLLLPFAVVE